VNDVFSWLYAQAQGQIFGGIAAASVLGYLGFALRAVPAKIMRFFERRIGAELTVRSDDPMFLVMARWLAAQPFTVRARRLKLIKKTGARSHYIDDEVATEGSYALIPAPGYHWFWYHGYPILLHAESSSDSDSKSTKGFLSESFTMYTYGRSAAIFRALVKEAAEATESDIRIKVWTHGDRDWDGCAMKWPRPLSSVITRAGIAEAILRDAREFLDTREWYLRRGIPWRRGYLLMGPPGTGKTSLVFALASELRMSIYSISLGVMMDDGNLLSMFAGVPERSVVLIEDVDAFDLARSRARDKKEGGETKTPMTLSGLLNALDGVVASDGRIVILTTNHPERLDPALTRAGRVDCTYQLSNFTQAEALQMWRLFFGSESQHEPTFLANLPFEVQPAALQELFMLNRNSPGFAAMRAKDLKEMKPCPSTTRSSA
jgi:chaperone BCS1